MSINMQFIVHFIRYLSAIDEKYSLKELDISCWSLVTLPFVFKIWILSWIDFFQVADLMVFIVVLLDLLN